MDITRIAHLARSETRVGRALQLLNEFGEEGVQHLGEDRYLVIAADGERFHWVTYGGDRPEHCSCRDHAFHPEYSCKHLLAAGIKSAKRRARSGGALQWAG